jgi:threonine synthase
LDRIGAELGLRDLLVKDEGLNPTGTFKARGAAVGVARARDLGVTNIAMPTAGNAGGAWAAYCANAGLGFRVIMPADAPVINMAEARIYGSNAAYVDGLISDAGRIIGAESAEHGWYDASTLKEPYRIEGKKTMGLEIAEQLGWELPDVIFYPAGGGVGLIGIWKALDELEEIGWIGSERPRLVAVQADGCAPLVRAWNERAEESRFWDGADTIASGLRVPKPLGDRLVLRALRETDGTAISVSDRSISDAVAELSQREGLFVCPEGASMLPALRALREAEWIKAGEQVVLLNTGTGLKYPELVSLDGVETLARP